MWQGLPNPSKREISIFVYIIYLDFLAHMQWVSLSVPFNSIFNMIGLSTIMHNCFVALSCDAPESKQKLKGHQISEKFDTNEEVK